MASPGPSSPAPDPRRLRRLSRGFAGLVVVTLSLIVLGALVRAHGAGMACPDWPLCFGNVIPELDLLVAFEFGHRVLAGSVALAFLGLTIATLRTSGAASVAGGWLAAAAGLLGLQILLGALTVWKHLAAWTVTSHLLTGNAFAVVLLLLATRLHRAAEPRATREVASDEARGLVGLVSLVLFVQMVLGGLVSSSYAGLACPEWPTCNGGAWFPSWRGGVGLHLLHRTAGYLLGGLLALSALRVRRPPRLARTLRAAALLAALQIGAGVANVVLGLPVEVTGLHSALAAGLVLLVASAVHESWAASRPVAGLGTRLAEAR